jgi:UDP-glucose 4-epimerase
MKNAFVTGAAGFIGSNLVDWLLNAEMGVVGWDNLSTGREEFLWDARKSKNFRLMRGDNLDLPALTLAMRGCDFVFHLAANADVRFGLDHPDKDLRQNTVATFHVLEAMRANGIQRIAFSSTGSVYGETKMIPTPENPPFPLQTSLYAASKVAGEALIQAYCEGYGFEGYIFRFVSILGERYTHGHVYDFYRQLFAHPERLTVLGDGYQRKSYLYVHDCIRAILHVINQGTASLAKQHCEIYNLGTSEYCTVRDSISWICGHLGLSP